MTDLYRNTTGIATYICVHAFAFDIDGNESYCDPDDGDRIDGWNVHIQHRYASTGGLVEPWRAPDLDLNFEDYATAYLIADALAARNGWTLEEY